MSLAVDRCHSRWYELIDHPVQLALLEAVPNGVRFPVVPAGRRSGKTERFKRFLAKEAMKNPNEKYFIAAPTHDQVKKIYWDDMKLFTFACTHERQPSETDRITFEEFVANENREMTSDDPSKQNISKCMQMANYVLNNNGTIEE